MIWVETGYDGYEMHAFSLAGRGFLIGGFDFVVLQGFRGGEMG